MPHYKKVFDIGTYTGNGGIYRVGIPTLRGVGPGGKQIANSLRFRSGQYLLKSSDAGGYTSMNSFSFWVKRGKLGSTQMIYSGGQSSTYYGYIAFNSSDQIQVTDIGNGSTVTSVATILGINDTAQWYHICVTIDTAQATSTNRIKIYVNGVNQPLSGTYPSQGYGYNLLYIGDKYIGAQGSTGQGPSNYFDGYLAHFYKPDFNVAYDYTYYAEFNSDGILVPKTFSGTLSSAAFYLQFAASGIGTDSSGYNNNFTPTGFNVTTANTTYDIMTDSPTDYLSGSMSTANNAGNYATFSSLNKSSRITLSNGNLTAAKDSFADWNSVLGPYTVSSGKWYYEFTLGTTTNKYFIPGYVKTNFDWSINSNYPGQATGSYGLDCLSGNKRSGDVSSSYGSGFVSNDVAQVALDLDNGKIWWGKNGTWFASGDPAAGTNAAYTGLTGSLIPAVGFYTSETGTINFGQRPFAYTPPTGFAAINTYNYSRPADSSLWFYGDSPDFMWIKNRGVGGSNVLSDTVKGINLAIFSDTTGVENGYPYVMEMNKFGMSLQAGTGVNASGSNFVYWAWKAGSNTSSSSVTNTSGSITSQVSANRLAGFSIVSYTGTGANATVGHGLGAAPNFIIVKIRNSAVTANWGVYHSSLGNTQLIRLDSAAAAVTSATAWNNTSPTSSVFSVGTVADTNYSSSATYIAYCWTAIPGFSAFGSYTGNGSSDGPFVYLGFRPRWLMVKEVSGTNAATAYWCISDSTRSPYNDVIIDSFANTNDGEVSGSRDFDYLSNGFKLRNSNRYANESSGVYIYAAFAELPFKFARAR
jgi:hypothetical protein